MIIPNFDRFPASKLKTLRGQHRGAHGWEHGRRVSSRHIGAQTHLDALANQAFHLELWSSGGWWWPSQNGGLSNKKLQNPWGLMVTNGG